ncbi:hypothetical protein SUGI_0911850 [Cryptomeria japonica]|uniref:probable dolichyl pyrophosphate Man9GlcNAc2 alpha-1,3-glucosyltransferase n=1 Tax=Cryptomeria japonica TaxID=3369 RepID=UPI0024147815|nr:probable dolichyl pyrophosphate Man9GlcNAc2 alpha-1,3-glucosyltransferase [Cryptomeria japonica]GLJ43800.1 hypothetical protein SUGI_0911850 [Cryptomeria japonica]
MASEKDDLVWVLDKRVAILSVFAFAFLVRVLISLHPYSGEGKPPMYGDYEAQRHWMEITVHTPVKEWYRNTTNNDLKYWGLDYPPLTAYQSYVHGLALQALEPQSVALHTSRGYETPSSKLLMRWTVLSSDVLIFFPAVLFFIFAYYQGMKDEELAWALAMVLLQPCLMLIDHGHFQYNCISLGFTVGAIAAVISRRELLASVLFCLALNHKQMSAYYAPAFFAHLLGKCIRRQKPIYEVIKLGLAVLITFTVVWWPFIYSKEAILEVLARLAPFERGIYEDYVSSFWCATSLFIKWKQRFSMLTLSRFALGATLTATLPSMVQQICAPSNRGFLYALLNSSFAFYLFSYQVHEKSVLLPLLPASLLVLEEPRLFKWLIFYAMLSMYPLLRRDELTTCYIALLCLFILLFYAPVERKMEVSRNDKIQQRAPKFLRLLMQLSFLIIVILHLSYMLLQPPKRYPFIFEALITSFAFSQFAVLAIYTNIKQWRLPRDMAYSSIGKEKIY